MTTKKLGDLFPQANNMAIDPVCHMEVNMAKPLGGTAVYEGKTYYFCGSGCNKAFTTNPAKYLTAKGPADMHHM